MTNEDLSCLFEGLYFREYIRDYPRSDLVYLKSMDNGTVLEESINGVRRQVKPEEYTQYIPLGQEKRQWLQDKLYTMPPPDKEMVKQIAEICLK